MNDSTVIMSLEKRFLLNTKEGGISFCVRSMT